MTMMNSFDDFVSGVTAHLTADERARGVAYAAVTEVPFAAGTQLQFPGAVVQVKADSWLVFIDLEPMANWGHPARYLLLGRKGEETWSLGARLPPFQPGGKLQWRVIYKAPSVPDAAVAIPQ